MSHLFKQKQLYVAADRFRWKGRVDGEDKDWMRWHQWVSCVDLLTVPDLAGAYSILGFCSDEGVSRNLGRAGAKDGPATLRDVLANLPVYFSDEVKVKDCGDILVMDSDLESSQEALGQALATVLRSGGFPIVFGGGHEVTYGHYLGIKQHLGGSSQKIGFINLDAHLDMRPLPGGFGNSGTGFYQIEQDLRAMGASFHYLAIGIQQISNTRGLCDYAQTKGVQLIRSDDLIPSNLEKLQNQVRAFAAEVDYLYLTIDLDMFAAPYAPGVSAPAFNGVVPNEIFFGLFETLIKLPNLRSLDIAELNPRYDIDGRTAKLAADLLFKFVNGATDRL